MHIPAQAKNQYISSDYVDQSLLLSIRNAWDSTKTGLWTQ